ncbi:MAG: hypothetical protein FWC89_03430 [Defluviitaleaceae bacterium]|nr:hypothetical protein [Defluviitaleaceae bacterium]
MNKRIVTTAIIAFIAFFFSILGGFIYYENQNDGFQDLPIGASNGEWAIRAIAEDGDWVFTDIWDIESNSCFIFRGEITTIENQIIPFGDTEVSNHLYSVYTVQVLDVFKGDIYIEDTFMFIQMYKAEGLPRRLRRWHLTFLRSYETTGAIRVYLIRSQFSVGDDLIFFASSNSSGRRRLSRRTFLHRNTFQTVYRYAPQAVRDGHDNWVFEPINEHNNIVFTESDLLCIMERYNYLHYQKHY